MKKTIALALLLAMPILAFAQSVLHHWQVTNTNAFHGLHVGCYQGTLAGMAAVTNQWAGDCYQVVGDSTPTNNGQHYEYQSSVPAPTPAFGTGQWFLVTESNPSWTPTPSSTPTSTPTASPTATPSGTPTAIPTAFVYTQFYFSQFTPTPSAGTTVGGYLPTAGGLTITQPGTYELGAEQMVAISTNAGPQAVTVILFKGFWFSSDGQNNFGRPNAANIKSASNFGGFFFTDNLDNVVFPGTWDTVSPSGVLLPVSSPVTIYWVPELQYVTTATVTHTNIQTSLQAWLVSGATQ